MKPYIYRLADHTDLDILVEAVNVLTNYEQSLSPEFSIPLAAEFSQHIKDWLATLIQIESACIIICTDQNKVFKGFITGQIASPPNKLSEIHLFGKIDLLWVEPDARHDRIASNLVEAIEHFFRENEASYIEVEHVYSNTLAKQFWQKSDYKPTAVIRKKNL